MRSLRALVALAVVSWGVSVVVSTAAPAAAVACAADDAGRWLSCTEVDAGPVDAGAVDAGEVDGRDVVTEVVTYRSPTAPAPVEGTICRPSGGDAHPILVLDHGGFRALRPADLALCTRWAADGWYVVASHYRPMNVGPPGDDLCAGEVDDVLAMVAIARTHPSTDPERVVMRGGSHGGCVTLRAVARGVPGLVAAAAFMPLSDPASTYAFSADPGVRAQVARSLGGPPGPATEAAVAERSDEVAAAVRSTVVPLLITHGVDDAIIDVHDSCRLVRGAGFVSAHVGPAPAGCVASWSASDPRRTGWPADRYFLTYAGVGHGNGRNWSVMGADIDAFLRAKAPAHPPTGS